MYKVKLDKGQKLLLITIFILLLGTCTVWFNLKEYMYFGIYLTLTIILFLIIYYQKYYLEEKYLIVKIVFLKIKFNYLDLELVSNTNNSVKIKYKNLKFTLYPERLSNFTEEVQSKIDKQKFANYNKKR